MPNIQLYADNYGKTSKLNKNHDNRNYYYYFSSLKTISAHNNRTNRDQIIKQPK